MILESPRQFGILPQDLSGLLGSNGLQTIDKTDSLIDGHNTNQVLTNKHGVEKNSNTTSRVVEPQDKSSEALPACNATPVLLPLSAYSAASLDAQVKSLSDYTKHGKVDLCDLAYTLGNRREQRPYRAYAVTADTSNIQCSSINVVQGRTAPSVAWVFTGQGAQWPGMGAELIEVNDVFRSTIRKLDAYLQSLPNPPSWSIEGMQILEDDSNGRDLTDTYHRGVEAY